MIGRSNARRPLDVIVIGAGQSGLAMGRELERAGYEHLMLDGARAIGSAWINRWDSLKLFTPAAYSGLRGIPFPAEPDHLPSRIEVANYLQQYAKAFSMPIALDEPVRKLRRGAGGLFEVETDYALYRARQVVIATGGYQSPKLPAISAMLRAGVTQLHSSEYRNPAQLASGSVLVVGAGNSGVQIAQELSATHDVTLAAGSPLVRLPQELFGRSIFEWLERTGAMNVTVNSRVGRRVSRREFLIGESAARIGQSHGVRVVPRIVQVIRNRLRALDGSVIEPRSVVWATGFKPSYGWCDLPVFRSDGRPLHTRGVTAIPGLYFLGLPWQHTRGSSLLGWVARDAEHLAWHISRQLGNSEGICAA